MNLVTKWAAVVIGIGAIFVIIGELTYGRQDFIFSRIVPCGAANCPRIGVSGIQTVAFGMLFYGSIFIAIGALLLFIQHLKMRRMRSEGMFAPAREN